MDAKREVEELRKQIAKLDEDRSYSGSASRAPRLSP